MKKGKTVQSFTLLFWLFLRLSFVKYRCYTSDYIPRRSSPAYFKKFLFLFSAAVSQKVSIDYHIHDRRRGDCLAVTAIRAICCILYGIASYFDEKERQIPRVLSYLVCLLAVVSWCIQFFINRMFIPGNLLVSIGFMVLLLLFCKRGQIGQGDLYLIFSMLVLLSSGQPTLELLFKENLLFCIAFLSAAIRLLIRRIGGKKHIQPGCPLAIHLMIAYIIVAIG